MNQFLCKHHKVRITEESCLKRQELAERVKQNDVRLLAATYGMNFSYCLECEQAKQKKNSECIQKYKEKNDTGKK